MSTWNSRSSIVLPGPADPTALHRQVAAALRTAIVTRALRPGDRLPSTRGLARDLGLSRNTVLAAYDQLIAEGLAESRPGSGTLVSGSLPEARPRAAPAAAVFVPRRTRLSARGLAATRSRVGVIERPLAGTSAFRIGSPILDHFPRRAWARMMAGTLSRADAAVLDYAEPAGYAPLREAIVRHLAVTRGVRADAAQVLVVEGAQHALSLTATLLIEQGDPVWLEDPGYLGARAAFQAAGARIVPVPVDDEGLMVAEGIAREAGARLVYLSPSHQYPLGGAMSLRRRFEVLDWADRADAWVVEDDYDCEFRYAGRALPALQGLDRNGRVIHVGTFSKVLAPALRLGFVVLPHRLVDPFERARAAQDRFTSVPPQVALARFIREGRYARHVRRIRAVAAERQRRVLEALRLHCGGRLRIDRSPTGLHLVGWLAPGLDDRDLARRAAARNVEVQAVSSHLLDPASRPPDRRHGLLFGYGAVRDEEIGGAAATIGGLLRSA